MKLSRIHISRDKPLIWYICDALSHPWQTKPIHYLGLRYAVCKGIKRRELKFAKEIDRGVKRGYIIRQPDGWFVLGKHSHADKARARRKTEKEMAQRTRAEREARLAENPPAPGQWSNLFVGMPLTADSVSTALRRAQAELAGIPISVEPNRIIMPSDVAERYDAMLMECARSDVARAERRARKGILSGRFGKRRRQRAQGIAKSRIVKKREATRMLPFFREQLRRLENQQDGLTL